MVAWGIIWTEEGSTTYDVTHDILDTSAYIGGPFHYVHTHHKSLQKSLKNLDQSTEHSSYLELAEAGGTDLFANFVEFDSLYGHRRDIQGYGDALEAFDKRLPELSAILQKDDLVIITADHGCDPSWTGTDHTRERVPIIAYGPNIAPKDIGVKDYIGTFCVAIFGAQELASDYRSKDDDYSAIMVQALADRFAEAFAEYLHKQVRVKHWGYVSDEDLSNEDLIKENYKGIRPAPGYPACPDHLEKETIWDLLEVEKLIGVSLTESLAMWPAAAVSGYYFANPEAKYFGLGKITDDQVSDYAKRKGVTIEHARKWLHPNLAEE